MLLGLCLFQRRTTLNPGFLLSLAAPRWGRWNAEANGGIDETEKPKNRNASMVWERVAVGGNYESGFWFLYKSVVFCVGNKCEDWFGWRRWTLHNVCIWWCCIYWYVIWLLFSIELFFQLLHWYIYWYHKLLVLVLLYHCFPLDGWRFGELVLYFWKTVFGLRPSSCVDMMGN